MKKKLNKDNAVQKVQTAAGADVKKKSRKAQGKGRRVQKLKVIPLGGLEHIGMNITCFEYEDEIIVIDCGMAFPEDDMLGIDIVLPDITYLEDNIDKVRGFFITHGHEDHIGALPYVLKKINAPVYATKLTMGIIEHKLLEHRLLDDTERVVVKHGETISTKHFKVEFIKTNHSIADAAALAIYTPAGTIVHTGDFKVDYTPVFGGRIDLNRFAELGEEGVLALMIDSTNAEKEGFTQSETTVGRTINRIFDEHKKGRIIIATFASNVDRVQQIINAAHKHKRKVIIEGRSMVNYITVASELGYITIPNGTLVDIDQIDSFSDDRLVLITTGSQGETMAALSRIAADTHRKIAIKPGDTVVFSSSPIPGNEKAVTNVINELYRKGAEVIFQDTHVSGHARQEELKLIYALTRPKYAIPVHGEYKHLIAGARIASTMGYDKDHIIVLSSGDVLEISEKKAVITGQVQHGIRMIEGLGSGDVGNVVMRDRQSLAQNGFIVVAVSMLKNTNEVLSGPEIVTRGFVYVKESEDLIDDCRRVAAEAMQYCFDRNIADRNKLRNTIKDKLGEYLWKQSRRTPVILPVIMEVE
ncbi:MAG: ribonuclease J [Lachnospiraceae bacterium]|nr:ribonuclease J [Lachnospiraceae bacterium]